MEKKIKKYRLERNMTSKQVADCLGVTQSCITQYETGKRKPSVEMMKKYARLFNCLIDDLIY